MIQDSAKNNLQTKFKGSQTSLFTSGMVKPQMISTKATVRTIPNMIARPTFIKQSRASFMPQIQLKRSGANTTVMMATSGTTTKIASPSLSTASVSAAFDQSKIVASSITKQSIAKMPLQIENSSLAQSMWCRENDEGAIQCDLEASSLAQSMWCRENDEGAVQCDLEDLGVDGQRKIEFDIDDILERDFNKNLDQNFWDSQWDEQTVYKFKDESNLQDDFAPFSDVIRMALEDYDRFVYGAQMIKKQVDKVSMVVPEFKTMQSYEQVSQDYNKFNIQLFYDFCKKNPIDGQNQDHMYPFINLDNVNQSEFDSFVLGSWIQIHQSEDEMEKVLNEEIAVAEARKASKNHERVLLKK